MADKNKQEEANNSQTNTNASNSHTPNKKKKGLITGGVIVAVIIVAAIGGFVWHNQPSFCNAICHTPMDGYLETYEATPGQAATDKWGNKVENACGMLASVHRTNSSKANCLSCHQPVLSEQVSEGMAWIGGNYTLVSSANRANGVLAERTSTQLTKARNVSGNEFCLNSGCHNMTTDDLTKKTQKESSDPSVVVRNPHSWQHGQQECTSCHKAHRASVLTCTECHATMDIPEGWISAQEARALEEQS